MSLVRCLQVRVSLRYLLFAFAALFLAATAASVTLAAAGSHGTYSTPGTAPLRTAVFDPFHMSGGNSRPYEMTRNAGAQFVRLTVRWNTIAPATPPAGFDPADPTSPGYSWGALDAAVEAAQAAGLTAILDISATPKWAYAHRPSGVNAGSPKAAALGAFAQALATHYDGQNRLPDATIYEVWNEPNLSLDMSPVSPSAYRALVNAVADSVHAVDPADLVVAGDLDPFGHPKSKKQKWYSVAPLAFMRSLLCVSKGPHPHSTCSGKVHFDVWSHHPYTFGGAFGKATGTDNVELGDLPKMRSLLQAGVRLHHVASSGSVQFWVTEFGWDTNPPRRGAASLSLASRWTAESLYQAWRSGISLLTWFDLEDKSGVGPYKSGLYFHASSLSHARPKPVLTAFRFPFVAYLHGSTVSVWGRDATSDKQRVTIQLKRGNRWRTVAYVVANSNGIFRATVRLRATKLDSVRAVAPGSGKSLAFSLTVPYAPHIGPWGN
jgi:Cellulase (glycosyl hydrolase family 5)